METKSQGARSILYHMLNSFEIPSDSKKEHLDHYFILRWTGSHFREVASEGYLTKDGIDYLIIHHHCIPRNCYDARTVLLSFRKHRSYTYGYVLVTPSPRYRPQISSRN